MLSLFVASTSGIASPKDKDGILSSEVLENFENLPLVSGLELMFILCSMAPV